MKIRRPLQPKGHIKSKNTLQLGLFIPPGNYKRLLRLSLLKRQNIRDRIYKIS